MLILPVPQIQAFLGSKISGFVIDKYFTLPNGDKVWHSIWLTFAIYALIVAVLFFIMFKHKHDPAVIKTTHPEPVLPTD